MDVGRPRIVQETGRVLPSAHLPGVWISKESKEGNELLYVAWGRARKSRV